MFREPLFDDRIKLAQSPLMDGPPPFAEFGFVFLLIDVSLHFSLSKFGNEPKRLGENSHPFISP
jgi:hypothetical protein